MSASSNPGQRVAIVTGAGRNIGRAIALGLAADGIDIVVNARSREGEILDVAREIEALGRRALPVLADVSDATAVAKMVEATIDAFGRIDILVNNAAIRREAAIDDIEAADWRAVMAVTLDAAFHCAHACVPHLRHGYAPTIVNIGGLTAHTGAKMRAHVVAAKAGLGGLTRALAHELASSNITVNCVSPGLIETVRDTALGTRAPDHHRTSANALGRRGTPNDVAAAVKYLCSPGARYVTGQTLHVNGGAWMQ